MNMKIHVAITGGVIAGMALSANLFRYQYLDVNLMNVI